MMLDDCKSIIGGVGFIVMIPVNVIESEGMNVIERFKPGLFENWLLFLGPLCAASV